MKKVHVLTFKKTPDKIVAANGLILYPVYGQ